MLAGGSHCICVYNGLPRDLSDCVNTLQCTLIIVAYKPINIINIAHVQINIIYYLNSRFNIIIYSYRFRILTCCVIIILVDWYVELDWLSAAYTMKPLNTKHFSESSRFTR